MRLSIVFLVCIMLTLINTRHFSVIYTFIIKLLQKDAGAPCRPILKGNGDEKETGNAEKARKNFRDMRDHLHE